ncbi:MAG TPA: helix-turn-helix transcriptional regulator [Pilimelia sp.]|nr:helix-turn-helix transcriptional regulator [Pilimelia sp.]
MTVEPRVARMALATFLRARRARVSPADVGLPAGGPRRTGGLRREEVAVLAGVSVTWYTWLEQGRRINASPAVLHGIARALRLGPDETSHLCALAGGAARTPAEVAVSPALQDLVDSQYPAPAYLTDPRWDLLAWNRGAEAVWGFSAVPAAERNIAWLVFHPFTRARLADWAAHGCRVVGELRASSTALIADPRFAAVLGRLRADHPEANRWWSAGEVRSRTGARKLFDHPVAGRLRLEEVVLWPASAPGCCLTVLIPTRDTDTDDRLVALLPARTSVGPADT